VDANPPEISAESILDNIRQIRQVLDQPVPPGPREWMQDPGAVVALVVRPEDAQAVQQAIDRGRPAASVRVHASVLVEPGQILVFNQAEDPRQ